MRQAKPDVCGNLVLVALGGNAPSIAGGPHETLRAALGALENTFGGITVSPFYQTAAHPAGSGPDFVNAACVLRSTGTPRDILAVLHAIEADFGRERVQRWGPRSLDLDLIAVGQAVAPDLATFCAWRDLPPAAQAAETPTDLILPHPRLADRAFVLVPLADVAGTWVHPVSGLSVRAMLDALPPQTVDAIRRTGVAAPLLQ